MDPNATWLRIIEALRDGNADEALEPAQDLKDWLLCDGARPTCVPGEWDLMSILVFVETIAQRGAVR